MEHLRTFRTMVCKLGARHQITSSAPTQRIIYELEEENANKPGYIVKTKVHWADRCLDWVVRASGSTFVFSVIQIGLLTWAFLGIPYHGATRWQILISDIQAIISYVFDSLLMRQQLNGYYESLTVAAELQSRTESHSRMLKKLVDRRNADQRNGLEIDVKQEVPPDLGVGLPKDDVFGRYITLCSNIVGHIWSIGFFWASIILWLAFGPANHWNAKWQLDMNSATSAFMLFIFSFLAIIHERHTEYGRKCLDAIYRVDAILESRLRQLTNDNIDNGEITILAPPVDSVQRIIDFYADIVGTLIGIALLVIVFVVWIALGSILSYSSNWWLLIGTYAGLIGMNDGFVLRNVQANLTDVEDSEFAKIEMDDLAMLESIEISPLQPNLGEKSTVTHRISLSMSEMCARKTTVVLGLFVIVGLVTGATVMNWNLTGQLLCNVPPSIIESFFMIILITGHNLADKKRRRELDHIYHRRVKLLSFVGITIEPVGR